MVPAVEPSLSLASRLFTLGLLSLLPLVGPTLPVRAQATAPPTGDRVFTTQGTVRRLLPDARLVLIAHDEIRGAMEAMDSMAFSTDEYPVLLGVKPGDHVRFTLRQEGTNLTLLRIELVR
jgi:Cu/Ag efflux protein CusF